MGWVLKLGEDFFLHKADTIELEVFQTCLSKKNSWLSYFKTRKYNKDVVFTLWLVALINTLKIVTVDF